MISKLDRIPNENEQFEVVVDGYLFQIQSVKNKMIHSVLVKKVQASSDSENTEKLEE